MDNASNNNTMMEGLEAIMLERKIPFDRDGHRIRSVSSIFRISPRKPMMSDAFHMSSTSLAKR